MGSGLCLVGWVMLLFSVSDALLILHHPRGPGGISPGPAQDRLPGAVALLLQWCLWRYPQPCEQSGCTNESQAVTHQIGHVKIHGTAVDGGRTSWVPGAGGQRSAGVVSSLIKIQKVISSSSASPLLSPLPGKYLPALHTEALSVTANGNAHISVSKSR